MIQYLIGILHKRKKLFGWAPLLIPMQKSFTLQGSTEAGTHGLKEIKFEMSYDEWRRIR